MADVIITICLFVSASALGIIGGKVVALLIARYLEL